MGANCLNTLKEIAEGMFPEILKFMHNHLKDGALVYICTVCKNKTISNTFQIRMLSNALSVMHFFHNNLLHALG